MTLSQTISQLKDKVGFGGDFIELSGLRSIKVEIFNLNNELIGPNDLKTTVFVQENINQTSLGTSGGKWVNVSDVMVLDQKMSYLMLNMLDQKD